MIILKLCIKEVDERLVRQVVLVIIEIVGLVGGTTYFFAW